MAIIWILLLLMELNFQYTFAYQVYNKTITISYEGSNSTKCCLDGECPCSSLKMAFKNVSNDTLINITSAKVALSVQTSINYVSKIGFTGSIHTVIDCNNTGGILFYNCGKIEIFSITWYQCGTIELLGAISFDHSHDISTVNCKFQSSNVYGIAIESLPGRVVITDTEFSFNNKSVSRNNGRALYIRQKEVSESYPPTYLELVILRSVFKYNGVWLSSTVGGIHVDATSDFTLVNISIEDSTFMHNAGLNSGGIYYYVTGNNIILNTIFHLQNVWFVNNSAKKGADADAVYCYTNGNSTEFVVTNSSFYNSIMIFSNTIHTSLLMDKSTWGYIKESVQLAIENYHNLFVNFSSMNIMGTQVFILPVKSNPQHCVVNFERSNISHNSNLRIDGAATDTGCQCSISNCQFYNNNIDTAIINIININKHIANANPFIRISNTTILENNNRDSIVRLTYRQGQYAGQGDVELSSMAFISNSASESTLYVYYCVVRINDTMNFSNNAGKNGAGIYFTASSYAVLADNADIQFANNIVTLGGGAIYADYPSSDVYSPWFLFSYNSGESVTFINNVATEAGNSIYFNFPTDVSITIDPNKQNSIIYIPSRFNYVGGSYQTEIATSPYNLILGSPAVCVSPTCDDGGDYKVEGIMLGEELPFTAKMVDYFNNPAESVIVSMECNNNCEDYSLTGHKNVLIKENPLHNITVVGREVKNLNTTITLYLSPAVGFVTTNIRDRRVSITILLSPCKIGFKYDGPKQACICIGISDVVQCVANNFRIKKGYWFGFLGEEIVVGLCPITYCDYPSCDINEDYCNLSVQNQCHSHRTGIACSYCKSGYTLAFDLEDCIPISDCHIWLTIVIIISVMIYWVVVLLIILCITGFVNVPVITGYAYGIIYFYSILYLFVSDSLVSSTMTYFIGILSGIANLIPRFLGILCFVKGLSGIDQQFIHYVHPLAISLLLFLISRVAKRSGKVTKVLGRAGIIRATCLLILLSYTSIASTSLQLLRPLRFTKSNGDHAVYTYLSPDIPYFTSRHIIYTIVAVICMIVIALGLPAFLLLQPYLKRCRGINFIRIMPFLDQFQQCFKPKYHSFAAFYLMCRLLVFLILSLEMIQYNIRFLLLQILSFIIAMIHAWLQPYNENKLNSFDQIILLIALMIVSLNVGIPCTSLHTSIEMSDSIVAILALLPLILFIGFLLSSTTLGRLLWQKITCNSITRHRGSTVRSVS